MSNREIFGQLFKTYYARLYYYALQLLKDEEASRDIVSGVFAHVWEDFASYDRQTLPAFLLKCVKNKCMDYQCYEDNDANRERQRQVEEMLDLLPDTTRHVLEECYLNHKKYREVAEEMNVCQETVKRHIMKALKLLREHYNQKKTK